MDTKSLIREAHARFNHNAAKQLLKEKYQAKLIIANQGGLWKATPELIGYLKLNQHEEVYLEDMYHNPLKVTRNELLTKLIETYDQVMVQWHEEYQTLKHKR